MRSIAAASLWFQALSYISTNRLMSCSSDGFVCAKQIPQTERNDRTNLSFITSTQKQISVANSRWNPSQAKYNKKNGHGPLLSITGNLGRGTQMHTLRLPDLTPRGCRIVYRVQEVSRDYL